MLSQTIALVLIVDTHGNNEAVVVIMLHSYRMLNTLA